MSVRFIGLFDDILLKITYQCTAAEVIALEKTCKTLRDLFSHPNRPLWLHLLRNLDDFHAPDLPPHFSIDALSAQELKRIVTRAVIGYANWNTQSTSGPRVIRKRIIGLKIKGGLLGVVNQDGDKRESIKIVPGGKYMFLHWSEGYLQCWDIEEDKTIWTYPQLGTFQEVRVIAYDIEHDPQCGRLFVVTVERAVDDYGSYSPGSLKLYWLNLETKSAALYKETVVNFDWDLCASLRLKIYGDAIIVRNRCNVYVTNKRFEGVGFAFGHIHVQEMIHTSDGYLLFVGRTYDGYKLFAMDSRRVFTDPHILDPPFESLGPRDRPFFQDVRLTHIPQVTLPTPIGCEHLSSVHFTTCRPTWQASGSDAPTMIYVIAKLEETRPSPSVAQSFRSRFCLYSAKLSASSSVLPASLTLEDAPPPVSVPLSHPYCSEGVHSLSHGGRGVLASVNTLHKGTRYYAFSFEELLKGHVRKSFGPISFGKDRVAPGEVYMEQYSGALAFVTKDQKSLVIQYYD